MKHFLYPLVVSAFILFSGKLPAQSATEAMKHPVILQHYSASELVELERISPEKLTTIIYYYTQSFIVEPIQCTECLPFDSLNFDVSKYEYLRKTDETFVRTFDKYGFKLTLIPVQQLTYIIPIQRPRE